MTISVAQEGSATGLVLDTQTALGASVAAANAYQLGVDLSNMQDGDNVLIEIHTKLKSGSGWALAYSQGYSGVQQEVNSYSIVVWAPYGILCYITQLDGTPRDYDYCLSQG